MKTDEFLAHYGVKGMQWGVRRERKSSSGSSSSKKESTNSSSAKSESSSEFKKFYPDDKKPTAAQAKQNFVNNSIKAESKTLPSEKKERSDFDYAKAAKIAAGTVVAGVVVYGAYQAYGNKGTFLGKQKEMFDFNPDHSAFEVLSLDPNSSVDVKSFRKVTLSSQKQVWAGMNPITEGSFDQKAFSLPEGHTFKRLSQVAETSFADSTYTTANDADWNRYLSTFRAETDARRFYEVSFQAKREVKVPDLKTRLKAVEEALGLPEKEAANWYAAACGSSWEKEDSRSKKFFEVLKSKGYDAIVDDMDAGVIADSPLIVINPDAFTKKTSRRVNNGDIRTAAKNLSEISNRRP